jgi:hypothetical protein
MAWQGKRGAGRGTGAPSSLEDLIRNQNRTNSSQPQQAYYPPQSSYPPQSQPFAKPGRGFRMEKNLNAVTPPRSTDHDSVSLEYSPPGPGDHLSPFQAPQAPPGDGYGVYPLNGKSSSYPLFDQPSWSTHGGGRMNADGRGRGGRERGRGSQKFSCRVCSLSFDSKPLLNAHLHEKQHFNAPIGDPIPSASADPNIAKRAFPCRVCNAVFDNTPALYAHLNAEGHYHTTTNQNSSDSLKTAEDAVPVHVSASYPPEDRANTVSGRERSLRKIPQRATDEPWKMAPLRAEHPRAEPPRAPEGGNTRPRPVIPPAATDTNCATPTTSWSQPILASPPPLEVGLFSKGPKIADISGRSRVEKDDSAPVFRSSKFPASVSADAPPIVSKFENRPSPSLDQEDNDPPLEVGLFAKGPKIADISGRSRGEKDDSAPVFRSSKFPASVSADAPPIVSKFENRPSPSLDQEDDGDDLHSDGQVVGTCTDMCPEEEIAIRLRANEVHLFEQPGDEASGLKSDELVEVLKVTMIKQYQRSAADHKLAIPHLVRTPRQDKPCCRPLNSPPGHSTTPCAISR